MARTTITYDDEINEWIEDRLVPGQSRTVWLRNAVETQFKIDPMLDELFELHEYEKRNLFVEKAVQEKVEQTLEQEDGEWNYDGHGRKKRG